MLADLNKELLWREGAYAESAARDPCVERSGVELAGFITSLPSSLRNTLQGGFNKRPRLVPGGYGVCLTPGLS